MKIHSEKGVSALEFALVLPLLLILTFGIIEFGILLFDKAVITNASREGARFGIVYSSDGEDRVVMTDADISAVVMDYSNELLINLGIGGSQALTIDDIEISPAPEIRALGGDLTVVVTYTYDFLVFPNLTKLIGGSFNGEIPLRGITVMRME